MGSYYGRRDINPVGKHRVRRNAEWEDFTMVGVINGVRSGKKQDGSHQSVALHERSIVVLS